ncbi:MAG: HTH-type transcriptional regulator/antitoxin HigA [Akkermansiaceae bacterium]|jgi:HTH-type transcriptional regulator/antitoxin HigA
MTILSRDKIDKFLRKHTNAQSSLMSWLLIVEEATWTCPQDIRDPFNSADFPSGNRIVIEQQDLTQKDLVPFIGSKSRVSEVLSGKRELTLKMVRALHSGLDIPLNALIQEEKAELPERIEVSDYPANEMCKLGYFTSALGETWMKVRGRGEDLLHEFFRGCQNDPLAAFNKQTTSKKSKVSHLSVHAWRCHVLDQSEKQKLGNYSPDGLNEALFTQLKGFSTLPNGPNLVCERLNAAGIAVIIAKQLTGTHLDGAALWHPKEYPVIGMTLRHNRLDNFWFVLFHELGHLKLHLESHKEGIFIVRSYDGTRIQCLGGPLHVLFGSK